MLLSIIKEKNKIKFNNIYEEFDINTIFIIDKYSKC